MTVTLAWLRLELRRRWRSLAVLALLVAFATTTVLASVAGARRAESAVERLQADTLPATAAVLPNQPGFDWDEIRALPQVEAVGTFPVSGYFVDGVGEDNLGFPIADDETMRTIERPVVLAGRMLDRKRVDEVVVSSRFLEHFDKEVGDPLTIRLTTPQEMDAYQTGSFEGPPTGPVVEARIVGVVRSMWYADTVGATGGIQVSPALFDRYQANIMGTKDEVYINALVRLEGGEHSLPAFREDLARVSGRSDIDVWNLADMSRHAQKVNAFEAACLLAFGLAALVAALVLVGQSVARFAVTTAGELQVLRAVGMTRRQATVAAALTPALAALLGGTLGVAGAVVASRWFPIGAAANLEPSPGVDVDWALLVTGWLVVPAAVLAAGATAAWLALAHGRSAVSSRRSAVAVAAATVGLPVPVVVGARFALEPGRGRTAIPVRPALFGAVTGVLGMLAAFTFSAGVSDAASNPARFGQTHEVESYLGFNGHDLGAVDKALPVFARDRDVVAVNDARIAVASAGDISVTTYTVDPVRTPLRTVMTSGRMPEAADEIVLAPTSAGDLGKQVGSTVRLTGNAEDGARRFRVVGIGFVPLGSHNEYDEGGWLTPAGYAQLFTGFKFHVAQIELRPGTDPAVVVERLRKASAAATGGQPVELALVRPPGQLAEIRDVRVLPIMLGGFLALLAVGAVGHALATAVRRRRYEMAVLRAVGMTRTQSRLVVLVQATLLASVGLLFGVPLGLALGRTLWRVVADNTPLHYQPPLAFLALVLVAPVAIAVANLLAALPARRATRLRVGHVLRTE